MRGGHGGTVTCNVGAGLVVSEVDTEGHMGEREAALVCVCVMAVEEVTSDVECVTALEGKLAEDISDVAVDLASVIGAVVTQVDDGVVWVVAVVTGPVLGN